MSNGLVRTIINKIIQYKLKLIWCLYKLNRSHHVWNFSSLSTKKNNLFKSSFIDALLNHLWWQLQNFNMKLQEICTRHYDNKCWYTNLPIHLAPSNNTYVWISWISRVESVCVCVLCVCVACVCGLKFSFWYSNIETKVI